MTGKCTCSLRPPCPNTVTEEDLLCDTCRPQPGVLHVSILMTEYMSALTRGHSNMREGPNATRT